MDGFTITELSSGNSGNTSPQIFGDNVVWQSEVDGNTENISLQRQRNHPAY